jgi:mRNA-degrading endonuclease toxin of MazEF toxin-antitoxin module
MASVGDLWVVDFGDPFPAEPAAQRPALVVGPVEAFGPDLPFVFVVPLTTTHRGLSLHVEVEPDERNGLHELSLVQCEQLRSVNRRRLLHPLGTLDLESAHRVDDVLRALLGH